MYAPEFRAVRGEDSGIGRVFCRGGGQEVVGAEEHSLNNWVKAARAGKLGEVGKVQRAPTELEVGLARVRKELAEVKLERDLLKKFAAYFAKESQ